MTRALGLFWPRAESNLYAEPKKLVRLGLASASPEAVGRRPRTVYSITDEGRRALEAWAAEPPDEPTGPVLEFEPLVRVFFAEHGSKASLVAAIEGVRTWAGEMINQGVHIPRQYLQGQGPFPERLPWLILCGTFLTDYLLAVARWADWAAGVVAEWPDDGVNGGVDGGVEGATPDWGALEDMADRLDEYLRITARGGAEDGR